MRSDRPTNNREFEKLFAAATEAAMLETALPLVSFMAELDAVESLNEGFETVDAMVAAKQSDVAPQVASAGKLFANLAEDKASQVLKEGLGLPTVNKAQQRDLVSLFGSVATETVAPKGSAPGPRGPAAGG